jgi:hypothetical protein
MDSVMGTSRASWRSGMLRASCVVLSSREFLATASAVAADRAGEPFEGRWHRGSLRRRLPGNRGCGSSTCLLRVITVAYADV